MAEAKTTVIVTQRERFGMTKESLESLYDNTEGPFEVVYVDGRSPRATADYLKAEAARRGFTLIRKERFLTPNEARNLGIAAAKTRYVAFCDNDVLYTPGWLAALEACAEETGAAVVAPLTCQGLPAHQEIHQAGGDYVEDPELMEAFFKVAPGEKRDFVELMHGHGEKVADWEDRLQRQETGCSEFHCALARRDVFDRIGPLDEGMLSTKEHIDFCMSVRAAGETVWFEPASVVTYVFPCRARPIETADWPFFSLRWSDAYGRRSLEHFIAKWNLDTGPNYVAGKQRIYPTRRIQGILVPLARRLPFVNRDRTRTMRAAQLLGYLERRINPIWVAINDRRGRAA
jgi:GT2 family glycosyltransferase